MAGSFSQQLEELLNPLPKFADPEDDAEEATKARVVDRFSEEEEDDLGSTWKVYKLICINKSIKRTFTAAFYRHIEPNERACWWESSPSAQPLIHQSL
uniref:Uncharacterized protein n=1 Tax=Cyprinodon variegatus TaxID=28743 RepID=A0A3Q2CFV7_CYPVA